MDTGLLVTYVREVVQTLPFRGRRSRNKVSVGEPAEGSLTCFFSFKKRKKPKNKKTYCGLFGKPQIVKKTLFNHKNQKKTYLKSLIYFLIKKKIELKEK